MTVPTIVAQFDPNPSEQQRARVAPLAEMLLRDRPELSPRDDLRPLVVDHLVDAPALILDDMSAIPLLDRTFDIAFFQERARLRASTGDFIASSFRSGPVYESYCRDVLGLGSPCWLQPGGSPPPVHLAAACWEDRQVRRALVHALRAGELLYVHPNMGIAEVWELAALLHAASRRPVKVIAPPPAVCAFANDKLAFADIVQRVLGGQFVPRTEVASNFAVLSKRVCELAEDFEHIGVKLTDSAGGGGTVVCEGSRFRGASLVQVRRELRRALRGLEWNGQCALLVGGWEADVLCSPSVQMWIPPPADGAPVVEGVFGQLLHGPVQSFVGSHPIDLPAHVMDALVDSAWLLASLLHRLGYVGRCSFDALLIGRDLETCRLEYVECNGRWGGTSIPMTLVNRLHGDPAACPFVTSECVVPGLESCAFGDLLAHFDRDLFDARTGTGNLVFYNPGRLKDSAINVLGLGASVEDAERLVCETVPRGIRAMLAAPPTHR